MRWVYSRQTSSKESSIRISSPIVDAEKHVPKADQDGEKEAGDGYSITTVNGVLEDVSATVALDLSESAAEIESAQQKPLPVDNSDTEDAAGDENSNIITDDLPVVDNKAPANTESASVLISKVDEVQAVDTNISTVPITATAVATSDDTGGSNKASENSSNRFGFIYNDYNAWVQKNLEKRMQEMMAEEKSVDDSLDPVPALIPADDEEDRDDPVESTTDGDEGMKSVAPKEEDEKEQDKLLEQGKQNNEKLAVGEPVVLLEEGEAVHQLQEQEQEQRPFLHKFNVDQIWGDLCGYYGMEFVKSV